MKGNNMSKTSAGWYIGALSKERLAGARWSRATGTILALGCGPTPQMAVVDAVLRLAVAYELGQGSPKVGAHAEAWAATQEAYQAVETLGVSAAVQLRDRVWHTHFDQD